MRRATRQPDDAPGQDSFLDIVANIVGILIILVIVVGVRAGQARRVQLTHEGAQYAQQITQRRSRVAAIQADLHQLQREAVRIEQEVVVKRLERQQWETYVLAGTRELSQRRNRLDDAARAEFDLQQQLELTRAELDRMTQEQIALEADHAKPIQVVHRPTPLSQAVVGREYHFQLRGGRIAAIPLDVLLDEFKSAAQNKLWRLADRNEMTDTVGPVGGFRLRYRLERLEMPHAVQLQTGRAGSVVRLVRWDLLPVSNDLGETVAEALAEDSLFRRALPPVPRDTTTITIWTYPDSFEALRALQEALHKLGYALAIRPLPDGMPIGGSPDGSRSAAQ